MLFPPPECLPDPGIKPTSSVSPASPGRFFTTEPPWEALRQLSRERCIMRDWLVYGASMEAKFRYLLSASWRPREAGGEVLVQT